MSLTLPIIFRTQIKKKSLFIDISEKGREHMKSIKKLNTAILVLTLLLVSVLSTPQPILAAEGEPQPITVPDNRKPYISSIYFGAGNQAQRTLLRGTLTTDVEYSQYSNTLRITFKHHKDDKDNIVLNEGVLQGITFYALGTSENLIDFENTDTDLIRGDGESTLTMKTLGLSSNAEYYLNIGEGLVSLTITDQEDSSRTATAYTPAVSRQFKTRTFPQVDSVIVGSVTENYNEREPIIIKGNYFNDIVAVYFNDIPAYDVYLIEGNSIDESYLRVYLPRGRNRLDVGTYDITVSNGRNHETILLSAFSVVKEREYLPNEAERLEGKLRIGNIIEALSNSDTTLTLNPRYSDTSSLQIDSDDIFGQTTLIRRIKYTANRGDVINRLETKSIWADISLSYVRPISYDRKNDIEIITGRPDPYTTQLLKEKLKGINIKSEFINISGSGYSTSGITLSIPYKDSNGTGLTVLRYDEAARRWEIEPFYIDETENRANIYTNAQGIFVIVEYED